MAVLLTTLCLVAYPGCWNPAEPSGTTPDPVPTVSQFAVKYTREGGLKAESLRLQIEPGRHATLKARGETIRFRVAPRTIRRLRAALEGARFGTPVPAGEPGTCADCYQYTIKYRGLLAVFDQSDQPRRFDHAVERLEALVHSHLPFH